MAHHPHLQSVLSDPPEADIDYLTQLACVKRFVEHLSADPAATDSWGDGTEEVPLPHGVNVDPRELRSLWDAATAEGELSGAVQRYRAFVVERLRYRESCRASSAPTHSRMHKWRERQMSRCLWELSPEMCAAIVHPPLAIELSRGCSVGCWFCGVGASKFHESWPFTDSNRASWRGLLSA